MLPIITIYIPSYMFFAMLGAIVSVLFLYFRSEKFDIHFKELILYLVLGGVGAALGGRILFVITIAPKLIDNFSIQKLMFYLLNGGLVFYGGLIGAIINVYIIIKIMKKDTQKVFNYLTPAFPLFHIFGRIGCFFAGCCYGKENTWGFSMAVSPGVIRVPVQLFESSANLLIFISLLIVPKYKKSCNLLIIYLLEYALCRFVLEFFRGDVARGIWGKLSTSQIVAIIMIALCFVKIITKKKKSSKKGIYLSTKGG